jgi:Protein of unknown function (DUF3592)
MDAASLGNGSVHQRVSAANAREIWILAAPFALVGLPLIITSIIMLKRRVSALVRGSLIEAEVVRWESRRLSAAVKRAPRGFGSVSASTSIPYVRYVAPNGHEITAKLDKQFTRKTWVKYPVGARMPVRIDPARPQQAYDPTLGSMFVFPGLLLVAGIAMTMLALGMILGAPTVAPPRG